MNKLFKRIVSIAMSASMCMSGGIAAAHAEDDPSWSFLPFEEINTDQTNVEGCSGLYDYAAWRSNEADETKFSVGSFGVYNCEWDLTDSALFMTGHRVDKRGTSYIEGSDIYISYRANVDCDGYYTFGAYGWMNDCSTEYFIIDDWGDYKPCQNKEPVGSVETEGGVYDIYKVRTVSSLCTLNSSIGPYQYWSVRREKLSEDYSTFSNTIAVSEHFAAWEEAGMPVDDLYEVMLCVDPYNSKGKANVLRNSIYYAVTDPDAETPDPNEDPYVPENIDQVTFTENSGDERGGYFYSLYDDTIFGEGGTMKMDVLDGGNFNCEWNNNHSVSFCRGLAYLDKSNTRSIVREYAGEDISIDYKADIESDGTVFAGSYGCLNNSRVDCYIVDGWKDWQISDKSEYLGTETIGDGIYDIYKTPFKRFFEEYWSVRKDNKLSEDGTMEGSIPVTEHFAAYVKYGLDIADPERVMFNVEGRDGSSGSAEVTKNIVKIDDVDIAVSAGFESLENTEAPAEEEDVYIPGDLNNDLTVDSFDLVVARRELIKAIDGNDTIVEADIDCSGATKINDLVLITRIVLGDEVSVPKTRPQRVK